MIKYEIGHRILPVVICYTQTGQCLKTEGGLMRRMSPNMQTETNVTK